jgi:hypothetical protein
LIASFCNKRNVNNVEVVFEANVALKEQGIFSLDKAMAVDVS